MRCRSTTASASCCSRRVVESEERHIDFLETQLELIKQLGVQLYSQKHIGDLS